MPAVNAPAVETDEGAEGFYGPAVVPMKDRRSKLIRSKEKYAGQIINACPCGCRDEDLDEQMYCVHLIGFTDPDDKRVFYPFKERPTLGKDGKPIVTLDGVKSRSRKFRYIDGDDPKDVLPTDKLVRISTSYRVYRDLPAKAA